MFQKNRKGFTLIELVVVIVIVGILAMVAVPIYRGYIRRANTSEGKALCGSVAAAQKVYFAEKAVFATVGTAAAEVGTSASTLGVDATQNKFFRTFYTAPDAAGTGFTVQATGDENNDAKGIVVKFTFSPGSNANPWNITDGGTTVNY